MNLISDLLIDLGKIFDIPLHIDSQNACTLLVNEKLRVQLEQEKAQERLIVAAFIGIIPAGKFRENLLAAALKSNHPVPRTGIFGFSIYNNQLALFEYLPIDRLNGEKLADFLALFIPKAMEWREAVDSGNISRLTTETSKLPSPLGLIR